MIHLTHLYLYWPQAFSCGNWHWWSDWTGL